MSKQDEFFDRVRATIARYLSGEESFDLAAAHLVTVLREEERRARDLVPKGDEPRPRQVLLRKLSLSEWINPQAPYTPSLIVKAAPLAPGQSDDDEEKAGRLFEEALRLLHGGSK